MGRAIDGCKKISKNHLYTRYDRLSVFVSKRQRFVRFRVFLVEDAVHNEAVKVGIEIQHGTEALRKGDAASMALRYPTDLALFPVPSMDDAPFSSGGNCFYCGERFGKTRS